MDMEDDSLELDASAVATFAATNSGNIVHSRRYDVSITYDKYWQTPKAWLFGYSENSSPLPPAEIFDDIMQDYAKKTVTIEPHPHLSTPHGMIGNTPLFTTMLCNTLHLLYFAFMFLYAIW